MGKKYKDIEIGDKFERWTVIGKGKTVKNVKGYRIYWICQCSCESKTTKEVREDGLLNNTSKGCSKCAHIKDLTGLTFGDLKVLQINRDVHTDYNHTFYDVQCKCGKIYPVRSDTLTCGTATNCGCNNLEHEDLVGRKFGKLTVLEYLYRFKYSEIKDYRASVNLWLCECECGNIITKRQSDLIGRNTCSCGCEVRSNGEKLITNLLERWKIKYKEQYRFDDCKYKNTLPFDIVIVKNNKICCAIEFDGEFHYIPVQFHNTTYEQAKENLITTHIRDEIKNQYCKNNSIPLIRIPYWELYDNNLEYILFDELIKCGVIEEINNVS